MRRFSERLLWAVGVACVALYVFVVLDAYFHQAIQKRELKREIERSSIATTKSETTRSAPAPALAGRTPFPARIEIPRLGVNAIVERGTDSGTLRVAVGHIPGTDPPGGPGNIGLAAHRDSFFRGLRDIRGNDVVRLTTVDGAREYRVEWTRIVTPDRVDVLERTLNPSLTLVTCYPFGYIGNAPKRFVVRARAD